MRLCYGIRLIAGDGIEHRSLLVSYFEATSKNSITYLVLGERIPRIQTEVEWFHVSSRDYAGSDK